MLVDDFSGSVMDDLETDLPTRALVELARAFLHAYGNPSSLTEQRLAELAPLFDVLLDHDRPGDVHILRVYVISAFDADPPLRDRILQAISEEAMRKLMPYEQDLIDKGEAKGEVKERARSVLGVLEHRAIAISTAVRERVLSTSDASLLQRWFDRAFSVASGEELVEG